MNDPIVIELQRLASDSSTTVDDLLRRALIVATKLEIGDFRAWVNQELHGYDAAATLPSYRSIRSSYPVRTVFNESDDGPSSSGRIIQVPFRYELREPIAAVSHQVNSGRRLALIPIDVYVTPKAAEDSQIIYLSSTYGIQLLAKADLCCVVNAIQNTILEWSLRLEQNGILGEGMRFSIAERQIATHSQNIHINAFHGILGDVSGSTVIQNPT